MYSVVLMMAVTSGAEAPDFGRRGCNGCNGGCHGGYVSCHGGGHGCFGGCSGCHSGGHGCRGGGLFSGLFRKHGCNGCNGCHGSCHGGYVGCHGSHGGFGGCTGGGYYGGGGYPGGVIVPGTGPGGVIVEPKTKEMPKGKDKDKTSLERPATIVVTLPEGARLSIDGNNTTSTSATRTFITPALDVNSDYVYTLRAEVMVEGRPVVETQTVTVRGGQMSTVPFNFSSTVASR